MNCTGIQDKNEVYIYDRDILKADNNGEKVIGKVWMMGLVWKLANYTTGKLYGSFDLHDWGYGVQIDDFEIIGNDLENPELITKKYEKI